MGRLFVNEVEESLEQVCVVLSQRLASGRRCCRINDAGEEANAVSRAELKNVADIGDARLPQRCQLRAGGTSTVSEGSGCELRSFAFRYRRILGRQPEGLSSKQAACLQLLTVI